MKIEIVEDVKERLKIDNKYVKDLLKGKAKLDETKAEKTMIMTPEVFAKVFSPEKIKLMLKLKHNNVESIYQLAKDLGRKYESVHRDIKYLKGMGIINIKEKDNKKIPYIGETVKMPLFAA